MPPFARRMPSVVRRGVFYEFHRLQQGGEIGGEILEMQARTRIKGGRDVYTPRRADAYTLANTTFHSTLQHPPHAADFFGHFQSGDEKHEYDSKKTAIGWDKAKAGPGHAFFNFRGEDFVPKAKDSADPKHLYNVERHKQSNR
jgi:hypothetical protein